jgi:putative transposase
MPRPLRLQVPGGFFHLTARGNRRQPIFVDRDDPKLFTGLFEKVVRQLKWRCHGYCLMPNHYHLFVETPQPNLSTGMQYLNGIYAQWFNWTHGYNGHLFQGRFWSKLVETDDHLREVARYIVLNPVRAGLCEQPERWSWSSYNAMLGRPCPEFLEVRWLLSVFDDDPVRARAVYRQFVLDGLLQKRPWRP